MTTTVSRLDAELALHELPHVILEGVTDKTILEEAYRKLRPGSEPFCEFLYADGATNIPPYLKSANLLSKEIAYPIVGLFDRDQEGRKQLKLLKLCEQVDSTEFYRISTERSLFAGLLAMPASLSVVEENLKQAMGEEITLPIPIEFMFPSDIINRALVEGIIELEDRIAKANDPELPTNVNVSNLFSAHLPEEYKYLARKVKQGTKTAFSSWVSDMPPESFSNFNAVFNQIEQIIQG